MTQEEVMTALEAMGTPSTKATLMRHGAREPLFGVKVGDMKEIVKKVKKDYALSLSLYNTGNADAMYLASLISDPARMTKKDLQHWAEKAYCYSLSEYSVPWTTAESPFALEMARTWMKSKDEKLATAGWNTYSSYLSITADEKLDKKEIQSLLESVGKTIHQAPNRVRHTMNMFLISVGGYVPDLRASAISIAKKMGKVEVIMEGTSCKVPDAEEYIKKMVARGTSEKKRKTAKC